MNILDQSDICGKYQTGLILVFREDAFNLEYGYRTLIQLGTRPLNWDIELSLLDIAFTIFENHDQSNVGSKYAGRFRLVPNE